jgi:HAD superfamily hydrolase (TIGR01509 family)
MRIKAILFDIDGTLVDSNDGHIRAWEEAFASIGETFERSALHDQMGKGADMLLPSLLPRLNETERSKVTETQGTIFKTKYRGDVRPFPDARALLAHARGIGQKVVLASSASKDDLDHYLDLLDAREFVEAATTSDEVERTKPAADIFAAAMAKLPGLLATDVLVVGDTPYDVSAAKKCGIKTVGLRSGGFSDDVLTDAGAIAVYEDVKALLADYSKSPLGR